MTTNTAYVYENDVNNHTENSVVTPTISTGSVLSFHNIRYTVEMKDDRYLPCKGIRKKDVLRGVSGIMKTGLNAIMGPTGSGKSSLLDTLAGRKDPDWLTGNVLLNGKPLSKNFRYHSGYVVQSDLMVGTVTVREAMWFSANLRLPNSVTHTEKQERIEMVMTELGLNACADTKVGTETARGISGGEKKRTSIAIELILRPQILFLDEPTTGLDAATASSVMVLLKNLADKGNTIVCSIHQPRYSIFKLFDTLTLMSRGNLVYHGPNRTALDFFAGLGYECEEHDNPADFMLDVLDGSYEIDQNVTSLDVDGVTVQPTKPNYLGLSEKIKDGYMQTPEYHAIQQELNKLNEIVKVGKREEKQQATEFLHQLKVLTRRTAKNTLRNPAAFVGNLTFNAILGVFMGIIFLQVDNTADRGVQNRLGLLFFSCNNLLFGSLTIIDLFQDEREIFIHEYASGYYRIVSYFLAKVVADLIPLRTITPIIYSVITYWMVGLKAEPGAFFFFLLTSVLVGYAAVGIGILCSVTFHRSVARLYLLMVYLATVLLSGLLANLDTIMAWLSWLQYLSITRYGFVAFAINELRGQEFLRCNGTSDMASQSNSSSNMSCVTVPGEEIIRTSIAIGEGRPINDWDVWQNIVAVICITIGLYVSTYIQLTRTRIYS